MAAIAWFGLLFCTSAGAQAAKPLPGSWVPEAIVLREAFDFAAVCVAEDEPTIGAAAAGSCPVVQRIRLLGLVAGRSGGRTRGTLHYRVSSDGFDRAVAEGERVIWLARCEGDHWRGVHVREDTPRNRDLIYTRFARGIRTQSGDAIWVRVETPGVCFAPGQPIPVEVQVDNSGEPPIALWSDFSALQFDVLAEDGEPVACRAARRPRARRDDPVILEQCRGPVQTGDLADLCDWLPAGVQRSYTLIWRAELRLGDRKADPVEIRAHPIRITVRDPASLAWGAAVGGVACGLAAEVDDVRMGDRVQFHLGIQSDTSRVGPDVYLYRNCTHDDVHFTLRNIETETTYRRRMDVFPGGPLFEPGPEDYFELRDHPVLLWTVPVRLLHDGGDQVPPGTYEVTATYAPRAAEHTGGPLGRNRRRLVPGPLVSAPVTLRVQPADPESVEIYTNSAIDLKSVNGCCGWTGSLENPIVLRAARRPGYAFHAHAVTSVAVGGGAFLQEQQGGYGGSFLRDGYVSATLGSGLPGCLGPDACRALERGESLHVRVDVTIYESADTYQRFGSPARGDSRVVWQGRLEAHRP